MTVGKIGVHEFITLDGVIGDPSWSFDYSFDPEMGEAIGEIMGSSTAILLGRRTYQEFAPSWSTRTAEDDPGAPFMNETPKYVVSASLQTADWSNSSILGPYSASTIRFYPLALGGGQRLFADTGPATKFALAGSEVYGNGVLHLTYSLALPAKSDA